jgi:SAM-dependent methyltransferase
VTDRTAVDPPAVPAPTVMPVDREAWHKEIHLVNFVNAYYQYRDLQSCGADVRRVLIVGPGQGLDTAVLRWLGFEVLTLDIDETFSPDRVGSVHDLSMFRDAEFDAVIASHVLEHMAVPYLDRALEELARVARHALIYLPNHGRRAQVRLIPGFRGIDISLVAEFFNYFRKPDGITPRYMQGQHFWEVGMRGFRVRDVVRRLEKHFEVRKVYRNVDWPISRNFVCRSRRYA